MSSEIAVVLREQSKRYPAMTPRDAAKLLYQSEFGPSHFSGTAEESLAAIESEYAATEYEEEQPLYEEIGGGFCRVNLAALEPSEYPLTRLNEDFTASAAGPSGSYAGLRKKVHFVTDHFGEMGLPFSKDDWLLFAEKWESAGFPVLSHSTEYKRLYHPAYRVISSEYRHDFVQEKSDGEPKMNRILLRVVLGLLIVLMFVGMIFLGRFLYTKLVLK